MSTETQDHPAADATTASAVASEGKGRASGVAGWGPWALRRVGTLIATFVVSVVLTFLIVPLIPGDPAVSAAGPDATRERIEQVRAELGLNEPPLRQFIDYVGGLLTGDMGHSFSLNAPVSEVILSRLPFTAGLSLAALLVVLVCAIPLGMAVGVLTRGGRRRWLDWAFASGTAFISAIPPYVMATLLILLFAVHLQILPPATSRSRMAASMVLPLLALSIPSICAIARVVRRETAVTLQQDYMRTASGWRLGAAHRYLKYALPNLLTSTLTLSGLLLIAMLGGAITVETVFNWPGLGLGIVNAVIASDYRLVQGIVLVLAMLACVMVILVDLILAIFDPRVRGDDNG